MSASPGARLAEVREVEHEFLAGFVDRESVVVCRAGARGASAGAILAAAEFRHVINLDGGMLAWVAAGLPVQHRGVIGVARTMATTTTHAPLWTLIRRTDVVSTHLIIYSHGVATANTFGNHVSAPKGKRVHFYTPHGTTLAVSKDTVRKMTEGAYLTHELIQNQHSYRNYDLTKIVTGSTGHTHVSSSANQVDEATLVGIVNASGTGGPGKPQGAGAGELGNDQACDILSIRHRAVGAVVGRKVELVSLLSLYELRQYVDIHCVFCRAKGSAPHAAAPANRP